ncbi:MAG TPA: hypothetical protein VFS81_19020 [Candidatus Binatia bacterium]|nr:hypothetical protein [Candidatus Binatia bacterium]
MVRFVLSSSPSRLPYKSGGYAIISRPNIAQRQGPQRKKAGDQHVGQLSEFRDLSAAQPQWYRPSKDVTLLSIAGSPDDRFAALIGGSVDATVVNSPFDYRAEQKGFDVLLSTKETVSRQNPHQRAEHVAAKNRTESPMKSCACCARCADGESVFANQREISAGLVEKLLKLDRPVAERFYAL